MTELSEHFRLEELIPASVGISDVPEAVRVNLEMLALELLEPIRMEFGVPVRVHDGWRPSAHNVAVGGVPHSDHVEGRAADFHLEGDTSTPWETRTISAFNWARTALAGKFGQLILEDHRQHYGNPGKLWVHIATVSAKHPGHDDLNAVLLSSSPTHYEPLV